MQLCDVQQLFFMVMYYSFFWTDLAVAVIAIFDRAVEIILLVPCSVWPCTYGRVSWQLFQYRSVQWGYSIQLFMFIDWMRKWCEMWYHHQKVLCICSNIWGGVGWRLEKYSSTGSSSISGVEYLIFQIAHWQLFPEMHLFLSWFWCSSWLWTGKSMYACSLLCCSSLHSLSGFMFSHENRSKPTKFRGFDTRQK